MLHDLTTATAALERARRSLHFTQERVTATEGRTLETENADALACALDNISRDLNTIQDALTAPPVLTLNLAPAYSFEKGEASHA